MYVPANNKVLFAWHCSGVLFFNFLMTDFLFFCNGKDKASFSLAKSLDF